MGAPSAPPRVWCTRIEMSDVAADVAAVAALLAADATDVLSAAKAADGGRRRRAMDGIFVVLRSIFVSSS